MQLHVCGRKVGPNQRIHLLVPKKETTQLAPTKIPTTPNAAPYQSTIRKHMATKEDMGTTQI